jgi:hypothetical protein
MPYDEKMQTASPESAVSAKTENIERNVFKQLLDSAKLPYFYGHSKKPNCLHLLR